MSTSGTYVVGNSKPQGLYHFSTRLLEVCIIHTIADEARVEVDRIVDSGRESRPVITSKSHFHQPNGHSGAHRMMHGCQNALNATFL
jgi:hypothetical protein